MKRAWVTIIPWDNRTIGKIERISGIESWDIFCVNNGWVIPIDFDETTIDENYAVATLVGEDWIIEEDTATKVALENLELETRKINWERNCMNGGREALVRFNRLLSKYNCGAEGKAFFMGDSDFQTMSFLLEHGAMEDAITLLTAKDAISYYTQQFKDEFLGILHAMSDEIGDEPT